MEEMNKRSDNTPRRSHKKRKKSFLSKEKKYAKQGRFGRGTHMEGDTFNYFLHVLEVKLSDFNNIEDKEMFIDNVFEQTDGKEVDISCNQLGSRAMETFLPLANDKIVLRFTDAFSTDLRKMCSDEFGSHVLQQLIVVVSSQLQKNIATSFKEENEETQSPIPDMIERFRSWLQKVCTFVVNNLQEFLWDMYANHVARTVLECLSGVPSGSTSKEKKREKKELLSSVDLKPPPLADGHTLITDCGNHFLQLPEIVDCVYTDIAAGLLQTLLSVTHNVNTKLTRKIVRHLLDCCYDSKSEESSESSNKKKKKKKKQEVNTIPVVFESEAATQVMDVMIKVASRKLWTQIYARCFINKLKLLSLSPNANFCVQNLIKHSTEKVEFEAIFDELSSNFEALVTSHKHGVLLALGQTCQRLSTKQGEFIKELQVALHCAENKERQRLFPLLVTYMVNYETWCENEGTGGKLRVSLAGSLLLQSMLNFPETIKIVNSLLDTDCDNLKYLFCDPRGSHIGDAFFASKTIGEKSREKLCRKLQGSYLALAMSQHGSRVLDVVWLWAPIKFKKLILEELAPNEALVNSVHWGNIVSEKSGLSLFRRRPKDWEEAQTRNVRAHKLFADIIENK